MRAESRYGKNSRQAQAAARKGAAQLFGALSGSKFYDDKGYRWLEEVKSVYDDKIQQPYQLERIDNTSFRLTYASENGEGEFEIIAKYTNGKQPYTYVVNYTVNSINGKRLFNSEDIVRYEELKAKHSKTSRSK